MVELLKFLRSRGNRDCAMVTSDLRPQVEIWPFRPCTMRPTIGTVRSLWTWLWGRFHVPQNVFLLRLQFLQVRVFSIF